MRYFAPLMIITVLSSQSLAQPDLVMREVGTGTTRLRTTSTGVAPQSYGFRSYDNWRFPNAGPPLDDGITRLTERLQIGGAEIGDDVHLVSWQPSQVSDLAYTMANFSTTQTITTLRIRHRFYSVDRSLLGEVWYWSVGASIPPGSGARIFSDGGNELRNFLRTEESMFMTIQFSDAVDFDISQMGVRYGAPITTGSSSRFAQNFTTGESIDLGEGNNLGFFIDTVPIPTPSTGAIALLASPLALRRRR